MKIRVIPSHQDSYIQNIIEESHNNYSSDLQLVNESIDTFNNGKMIQFSPTSVLEYIKSNSDNLKFIAEDMGFDWSDNNKLSYDHNTQIASIKESNKMMKVFLEDSIINNLDDFYKFGDFR